MERWRYLHWRYRKATRRIIRAFCSRLYRDNDSDIRRSIMVAGTGRSGTTWIADLIASRIRCRIMFEPFHSKQVEGFRRFHYFQYMRPDEENQELWGFSRKIFTGDIRHRWIDRQVETIFPEYRLVKDIRVNLFLAWLHRRFPEVPLLFVMRHPCAVVLSRMQLSWWTDQDIEPLLSQPKLVEDSLAGKMEVIRRAKSVEEKHAVVWCVNNLIPIRQFPSDRLNVVFYENLCTQPEQEVLRMFQSIGLEYHDRTSARARLPSTTAVRTSAIVTGDDKVTRWQRDLSPAQIKSILSIVDDFGLGQIYGDSATPLVAAL